MKPTQNLDQKLDTSLVESCWDCQHQDYKEGCTHPDQSLVLSIQEIDLKGLQARDCKGLLPIVEE